MSNIKAINIKDNEEYLRQISKEVSKNDKELLENIKVLEEYCINNEVMAMASVQLGIPKRLIYLKNTNIDIINKLQEDSANEFEKKYNESRILINPVIIEKEGLTDYWEACASCLDYLGHVQRPYKIKVEYLDINFNKKEAIFEGFESTVLSHEMDHLDGILHIDIADELLIMNKEERKKFRQTHGYNITYKIGDFEILKSRMKESKKKR